MSPIVTPDLVFGWPEFGLFMLANVIIFGLIGGKLLEDLRMWRKR